MSDQPPYERRRLVMISAAAEMDLARRTDSRIVEFMIARTLLSADCPLIIFKTFVMGRLSMLLDLVDIGFRLIVGAHHLRRPKHTRICNRQTSMKSTI